MKTKNRNETNEAARAISCTCTASDIRNRIHWIRWNLANPTPACRASRASLNAARRDANQALKIYRKALRLARA